MTSSKNVDDVEWEMYRETIRALYLDEDYSLQQVAQAINEKYRINATKAKVESRCKQWNFRKNLTREEWNVVGHKVLKRKKDDKASEVCLDGLPLNEKRVKKAISRYGLTCNEYGSTAAPSPPAPKGIIIRTPVLAPTALTPIGPLANTEVSIQTPMLSNITPNLSCIHTLLGYGTALSDLLSFMHFKSATSIEAQHNADTSNDTDPSSTMSVNDVQADVAAHSHCDFHQEPSHSFSQLMKLMLPRGLVFDEGIVATTASECQTTSVLSYWGLAMFMVTNNFCGPTSKVSRDLYGFMTGSRTEGVLEYMVSVGDPTSQALVERLFDIAIEERDVGTVKRILRLGVGPNKVVYYGDLGSGSLPLQRACKMRSLELVQVLLEAGAGIDACCEPDRPPLLSAIGTINQTGLKRDRVDMKLVNTLLDAGADVNMCDFDDVSPLMAAAAACHVELVDALLARGADPNFEGTDVYATPLHQAVVASSAPLHDAISTVQCLIWNGADINAEAIDDDDEDVPLLTAAVRRRKKLVPILLDHGALITEPALMEAVRLRQIDSVRLLLSRGARVTARSIAEAVEPQATGPKYELFQLLLEFADDEVKEDGRRDALLLAIRYGMDDMIEMLSDVELCAGVSLTEAIEGAVESGCMRTLHILLDQTSKYRHEAIKCLGSSLCSAIERCDDRVTELLLRNGADVNRARSKDGKTPLLEALLQANLDLSWRLLAAGASVNINRGRNPVCSRRFPIISVLPAAVELGDQKLIKHIIDLGAEMNAPFPGKTGAKTALTVAVERGHAALAQVLIENGADINAPAAEKYGETALVAAIRKNNTRMMHYLLENGANVNEFAMLAAVSKGPQVIESLLTIRLARCPHYPYGFGSRALKIAVLSLNYAAIKVLLGNGINPNILARARHNEDGENMDWSVHTESPFGTVLFEFGSRLDIVQIFLHNGANPNGIMCEPRNEFHEQCTPLLVAIRWQHSELVRLLIKFGADVNVNLLQPPNLRIRRTPLQAAVEIGDFDIIKLLIDEGADVNAAPSMQSGATALQLAAINGHMGVATLLLDHGAEVDAPPAETHGRTALEGASEHGRIHMVQLLLSAGAATIGLGSEQYERAQAFAAQRGHIAVKRLLQKVHAEQLELPQSLEPFVHGQTSPSDDQRPADWPFDLAEWSG